MKPAEYLSMMIEPAVADYLENPTEMRLAYQACIPCYHMVDAIARERGVKDEQKIYAELLADCPSLRTVKAVSLIAKHIEPISRGFKGLTSENVRQSRGAAFSDGTYYSDGTSHSDSAEVVVLQGTGFSKSDLTHAIKATVSFWRSKYGQT